MHHNTIDEDFDVTLQKLRLFACKSEIRITTVDTQSILCGTGTFSIQSPHAFLSVAKNGDESGTIELRTSGPQANIALDADTEADCVSLLTLNKKGILGVYGPPEMPAFVRLDENAVTLGKGLMVPGPTLAGKICVTEKSVIIEAGASKISVTTLGGIVIEVGETKLELSPTGIKQAVGIASLEVTLRGIEQRCAENMIQLDAMQGKINAAMVEVKAQTKAAINGLLAEMKAQGMLGQSAPLINL